MGSGTINASGGTYSSIQNFVDNLSANNDTGTITQTSSPTDTSGVTVPSTYTGVVLTASDGAKLAAATYASGNAKARMSGASATLTWDSDSGIVEKLSIFTTGAHAFVLTATSVKVRRCYIRATGGTTDAVHVDGSYSATITNCMLQSTGADAGVLGCLNGANLTVQNVSGLMGSSSYVGFGTYLATALVTDGCIMQGKGSDNWKNDSGTGATGDYNVEQAASTSPGAHDLHSQSGVYTDTGSTTEDFALTSAVTYAIVNRSGFDSDTDTDLVGTSRPSTGADAGVWQNPAAGGGFSSAFFRENAGAGAVGGGPFARANAGQGAVG